MSAAPSTRPAAGSFDLAALAARRRLVLKNEPAALVEVLGDGPDAVVRKTYRNRGARLLQTFLRRSRAAREHDNLQRIAAAGIDCTPPLGWSELRRFGLCQASSLVTAFVPGCETLKQLLADPATTPRRRRALAAALGGLLRRLHGGGLLWCTPMPRNVMVQAHADGDRLLVCDAPALVRCRAGVPLRLALLDLFDAVASPSRRREWSRSERLRCLLAYGDGDRRRVRRLWLWLQRRTRTGHRLRKNLSMALRTYILRGRWAAPAAARSTQAR